MYDHNPLASCIFPSPELAKVLIDALFTAVHPCSLVIHRASFEKCYYNNDHKVDPDFAALVLMTFALACKLIPDQVPNDGPPGKLYYDQARPHLLNALSPVSLVTFQGLVVGPRSSFGASALTPCRNQTATLIFPVLAKRSSHGMDFDWHRLSIWSRRWGSPKEAEREFDRGGDVETIILVYPSPRACFGCFLILCRVQARFNSGPQP